MKVKKIIGYILIIVGILIPLQAFTQISYRDIIASSKYEEYTNEYKIQDKTNSIAIEGIKKEMEKYNSTVVDGSGLIDPFVVDDYKSSYNIKGWNPDSVFGYLVIPSIDVKQPIRLDASYEHLDKGVAHVYGTSLPIGGVNRRSVIAGHRGWYRDIMLLNLGKMKVGDKVYIDREGEKLLYKVTDTEIISPSQWQKLKPKDGKDMLTLLSCHPIRPPSPYRLLVNCERELDMQSSNSNMSSKINKDNIDRFDKSPKRTMLIKYVFYMVTILGWLLVIIAVWRLLFVIKNKK